MDAALLVCAMVGALRDAASMTPIERAAFLAHAARPAWRARVDAALKLIGEHIDDHSYVSWSAGKDSMVVADLCRRLRQDVPILMVDPGVPTHWTDNERESMLAYAERSGWALKIFPWDKWRRLAAEMSVEEHRRIAHDDMFADLTAWADERGLDQRFVGLRAEESPTRAMHIGRRGKASHNADGRRWVAPIGDWRAEDVWAYIVSRDLPWLTIYDHLGPRARNGLIGRSGVEHGRLGWLKIHYPEAYEEAKRLMPVDAQYS
jgi:phosphoadenosine phosphosulfate reductase